MMKGFEMDTNSAYSFAITNATKLLRTVWYLVEIGKDERAAEVYLDYIWWMEWAKQWITGETLKY